MVCLLNGFIMITEKNPKSLSFNKFKSRLQIYRTLYDQDISFLMIIQCSINICLRNLVFIQTLFLTLGQMNSEAKQKTTGVILICGYLGSGKTTLIQHILKHQSKYKIAVIQNEFSDGMYAKHSFAHFFL